MNGWAQSSWPSQPRGGGPAADRPCRSKTQGPAAALERSIRRLEDALASCDAEEGDLQSTLELYSVHVKAQRDEIAALRAELDRVRAEARAKEAARSVAMEADVEALRAELAVREEEVGAATERADSLAARVHELETGQRRVYARLDEDWRWRKAALTCLRSEMSLAGETAALAADLGSRGPAVAPAGRSARPYTLQRPSSAPSCSGDSVVS
jgi:uncharacterized small protein (DUF1192 family)